MKNTFVACFILTASLALLSSCGNRNSKITTEQESEIATTVSDPTHNSRNSLDYEGIYEGTLPCADCPGIVTTLELSGDKYKLTSTYLERGEENTYTSEGTYTWNEQGNTITLDSKDKPNMYFVGENILYCLDMDGNRVEGELAEHYKLTKKQ